jgi:hypothetical protein
MFSRGHRKLFGYFFRGIEGTPERVINPVTIRTETKHSALDTQRPNTLTVVLAGVGGIKAVSPGV